MHRTPLPPLDPGEHAPMLDVVEQLHARIRTTVRRQLMTQDAEKLSREVHHGAGDVSFAIDVPAEMAVEEAFTTAYAMHPDLPAVVVIGEGLGDGTGVRVFPTDADGRTARWRVIIDPLDGSRELAYGHRSAWILTGIAPNRGDQTTLADIAVAVQTEVPPSRQTIGVSVRAVRGQGVREQEWNLDTAAPIGVESPLYSTRAPSVQGGFATFVHYFPGSHALVGSIADRVFATVLGPARPGMAAVFDDQYISTAGLLYLLASGRHRFVADLRPLVDAALARHGRRVGLCAHPYDLSTALIAEEAGAVIVDAHGRPLAYPLDATTDCAWIGAANRAIEQEMAEAIAHEVSRLEAGQDEEGSHA